MLRAAGIAAAKLLGVPLVELLPRDGVTDAKFHAVTKYGFNQPREQPHLFLHDHFASTLKNTGALLAKWS